MSVAKPVSLLFVCHGNICRSTMAQSVMQDLVDRSGTHSGFVIDSAATSAEEIGEPPHPGTRRVLRERGIPVVDHRARRVRADEYGLWDLILIMDDENRRGLDRIFRGSSPYVTSGGSKIKKLLSFAPEGLSPSPRPRPGTVRDVADPWYTGDFDATFRDIAAGCAGLLEALGASPRTA